MDSIKYGAQSGIDRWKNGPEPANVDQLKRIYTERELLGTGELFIDTMRSNRFKKDPTVYRNTSLLSTHPYRVETAYKMFVYQGRLSPEPEQGAIPIVPASAMNDDQVVALMSAITTLYGKWNWQRRMKLRPQQGARMADVFTELVDVPGKLVPFPRLVWPGFVQVDTDDAGNVQSYRYEMHVTEQDEAGKTRESFTYAKQVDKDAFRTFRDGNPHGYGGLPAVMPNPYGFVPAIWDNHILDGFGNRGRSATDTMRQIIFRMSSLGSHAMDYQHKGFFAPIIVTGTFGSGRSRTADISPQQKAEGDGTEMAKNLTFLEASPGTTIGQASFDIGQTISMLELLNKQIEDAYPEVSVMQKLADMGQVTGPGARAILLPIQSLIDDARDGYDPNTVHLLQMAISMAAVKLQNPIFRGHRDVPSFASFTSQSYDQGAMDFSIGERELVPPSDAERVDLARQYEALTTKTGMRMAGLSEDEANTLHAEQQERWMAYDRGSYGTDYQP